MTDIIDAAQETEQQTLAQCLRAHQAAAALTVRPAPTGYCLNSECLESFDATSSQLFCGPACAQRYDVQQKLRR